MRTKKQKQQKKRPFSRLRRTALLCAAVLVVTAVAVGTWMYFQDNLPPPHKVITHSTKKPSEKPVPITTTKYDVDPDYPKSIQLPSIGAEGLIQRLGIDQDTKIAVPTNIHVAGWYVDSVKPGDEGLSIINGHVDGQQGPGIFSQLGQVEIDDSVIVEYGDGSKRTFTVRDVMQVSEEEAAHQLFANRVEIRRQLHLITCIGNFDSQTRTYDQRVIVVAELDE